MCAFCSVSLTKVELVLKMIGLCGGFIHSSILGGEINHGILFQCTYSTITLLSSTVCWWCSLNIPIFLFSLWWKNSCCAKWIICGIVVRNKSQLLVHENVSKVPLFVQCTSAGSSITESFFLSIPYRSAYEKYGLCVYVRESILSPSPTRSSCVVVIGRGCKTPLDADDSVVLVIIQWKDV